MESKNFMTVDEVAQELNVSKSYAYKVVRELNAEMQKLGYLTVTGRVNQVPVPPQLENPITVNPFTEKSKTVPSITGIPNTEHPTQVIDNKVNNKRENNHQSI